MTLNRTLYWPACYNTRDLGGLPTNSGQVTRPGVIVRSDLPARLTAAGQQCLLDYGIRTILDLRRPHQVAQEPSIFMQPSTDPATPRYINISLENHTAAVDEQIAQAGRDRAQVYALIL
ncbi:MAG: tyrosine-protein phosphatase, partial [Caldilineaceae bacterium]|nr:tyrosine-protein phosphatase [Caldilineaceae bacterium]